MRIAWENTDICDHLTLCLDSKRCLVAVESVADTFMSVAHIGIMHRDNAILGYAVNKLNVAGVVAANILCQELAEQVGCLKNLLCFTALGWILVQHEASQAQCSLAIGHQAVQDDLAFVVFVPVNRPRAFETGSRIATEVVSSGKSLWCSSTQLCQHMQDLSESFGKEIEGILDGSFTKNGRCIQGKADLVLLDKPVAT